MRAEPAKGKNENIHKWYCSLCQVSAASEKNLNDHLQGKKHKAKAGLAHQEDGNGDSDSVVREKSLESEEGLNNEQEITNASTKPGKSQASEQEKVNTLNTVKIGLDRDEAETEELKKSGHSQEMNGKPVKLWHCKMCNEGTYDEATMANHRKSSKHMKLLREIGGGLIVVSNVPKEASEGGQGSQDAAVEC
ncbi:UBP1-associated proteins 1C-like [Chenopodium quinoa]|uniref:UBP1-associated proteins 1C-like n=1 Tax=Chenopodium quinoa TaxID=63459 RepID=UPI000B77FC2B|nr:UBP1-associated proteins 1C-like [Chenopodium quinoa]